MGFSGYLFKVGNYEVDGYNYINFAEYNVTWNSQDLDSYRDALGVLHRNALEHRVAKIEFETRENLTNDEVATFMSNIRANYTNQVERKATVTVFVPELNDYVTQEMYMSDPQFKIKKIDKNNVIKYEKTRIAFIGY